MKKQLCTPRKPASFLKDPEQLFFFFFFPLHVFNVRVLPYAQDRSLRAAGRQAAGSLPPRTCSSPQNDLEREFKRREGGGKKKILSR